MSDDLSIQPIKVAVIDDNIEFGAGIKMLLARKVLRYIPPLTALKDSKW